MPNSIMYVYVAGPYSQGDQVLNTRNAIHAGDQLRGMGFVPFIPHLNMLWHTVHPHSYKWWIEYDLAWLERCDAILRLPGDSSGANDEVAVMKKLGRPVFYSVYALAPYAPNPQRRHVDV